MFAYSTLGWIAPAAAVFGGAAALAQPALPDPHLCINQFGYQPFEPKVAVVRRGVSGFDAPDAYVPGPILQLCRSSDGAAVFAAAPTSWNGGTTHSQSGDQVWWFDFSAWRGVGTFYVLDPSTGRVSDDFDIAPDVHRRVLRPALRMFYYQRCGTAKSAAWAEPAWADGACHLGSLQDLDCRSVLDPSPATSRNLSGGWHDAGDFNKYVNYADHALHMLLDAAEIAPLVVGDSLTLPESGNGESDLLDEISWELRWLLKMQLPDGSVLHKVSVSTWQSASPASADAAQRFYAPPTASATISACGAYAHGAHVLRRFGGGPMQALANQLELAALAAWSWLEANPRQIPSSYNNQGFTSAAAEDDPYEQSMNRLRAAAHLFRTTGNPTFRSWFDARYTQAHLFVWGWAMSWEETAQSGLLAYAQAPGATPAVVSAIRSAYVAELNAPYLIGEFASGADAYRAHLIDGDYTWGTNWVKAVKGHMFAAMSRLALDPGAAPQHYAAGAGFLHYLAGVNPLGLCFLTRAEDFGATRCCSEMYHAWFGDGTVWDNSQTSLYGPPPGYMTGGVNPSWEPAPEYAGPDLVPPMFQPIQKCYRDWNTGWPENSWEITECHIPMQAAYVRLLAEFSACNGGDCACDVDRDGDVDYADFAAVADCVDGPGVTPGGSGCTSQAMARVDLDGDDDLDLRDLAYFQRAVSR